MNIFDHLDKVFNEIDSNYVANEVIAHSRGHLRMEAEYRAKRRSNDEAYFLYMFTRLEDRIRSLSNKLVDNKLTIKKDWKSKRSWENIDKDNIHFMKRVSLLTPKGQVDYNLIKQYYDQRNNIGHGGSFSIPIIMPTVIADMKLLFKELRG